MDYLFIKSNKWSYKSNKWYILGNNWFKMILFSVFLTVGRFKLEKGISPWSSE